MARITIPRQVGLIVAAARKERGLTQSQLAKDAKVSRQLVNRLETGVASGIALDKLLAILGAAGCALDVSPLEGSESIAWQESSQEAAVARVDLADWRGYQLDETLFDRAEGAE